jgi:hypothetical protein
MVFKASVVTRSNAILLCLNFVAILSFKAGVFVNVASPHLPQNTLFKMPRARRRSRSYKFRKIHRIEEMPSL